MSHPTHVYNTRRRRKQSALYGFERRVAEMKRIKRSRFWRSLVRHAAKRGLGWVRLEVL